MSFARGFRFLLSLAAILIVAWSFFDVGRRVVVQRAERKGMVTLTALHWGDQMEDMIVDTLVRRFEEEHPNVHVDRINPGVTDFDSKLKTMLAAGTPPDLFFLKPGMLPELAELHLVAPLTERFDREPESLRSDFFPLIINAFRYDIETQRIGAPTSQLYGLPKDFSPAVFYVNLDLFKAAGVAVPYGGWTWKEFEADMKRIRATSRDESNPIYGGFLQLWSDTLRNILWTFGGDFFGPGGFRDVVLDSPQCQAALQMIVRMRLIDQTVYNPTGAAKDGAEEFFNGRIGCIGPIGRWMTPRYAKITRFHWDVVPVPYETENASQVYYNAWGMSSATKHPDEAYELIKYLCGREGQVEMARLALQVPVLKSVAYSSDFLHPPGVPPLHTEIFLDAMKYARLQQVPGEVEWDRIITDQSNNALQLGEITPRQMADVVKKQWLSELDSPIRAQQWKPMRWNVIVAVSGSVFVALVGGLWWRARKERLGPIDRAQQRAGWGFISPWLIGFLALTLGPMIVSLLLSFSKWSGIVPMGAAESVGTANYRQLVLRDPNFWQSLKVTIYFVALGVPVGQIAALAIAMLMNARVKGIEWFRTIYFVPSVVSGVALAVLWLQIFNNQYGILNKIIRPVANLFYTTPPDWLGKDGGRWAVPAFVIMGLWGVGSGMIIYLAGLKGISASLYEAATIDGAGPARRFWNVTLPMLSPLIFYNLVMGIIASFQIFTQAKVMTDGGPNNATLFYVLSLYRQAFEYHNMGYASAMAWVLFLIVLSLTFLVFAGSKKLVYYEGLKN